MVWRRRDPNQLKKSGLTINSLLEARFKYEKLVSQQLDHQSGPKKMVLCGIKPDFLNRKKLKYLLFNYEKQVFFCIIIKKGSVKMEQKEKKGTNESWQENRILAAKNGTNPMLMLELQASYAVFGDVQFLPGYCVLLPKKEVGSLNDLSPLERQQFLLEMSYLGDAILASTDAIRINYDILGNSDQYLHAHVFPRYQSEPIERRKMPVWLYHKSHWSDPKTCYQAELHGELRQLITENLAKFQ